MFERFTDRARRATVLAQEESRRLGHSHIGTEHLLLGLVAEGESVAANALDAFSVELTELRRQVVDTLGIGEGVTPSHIPFTPRAKKCLELALRESLQLGHNYIGCEHVLLGIIREGNGVACQLLADWVSLDALRYEIINLLTPSPPPLPDLPLTAMSEIFIVHAIYEDETQTTYDEALAVGQKHLMSGAKHFEIEKRYVLVSP